MVEIVNLKQARKARARAERAKEAEANRLKFGRPKSETERKRLEDARADRAHDAHKIENEP